MVCAHWKLPSEEVFNRDGHEWFLKLLHDAPALGKARLIFLMWRVWHHRNNVVHGDGKALISASIPYLHSYDESYAAAQGRRFDDKGKDSIKQERTAPRTVTARWSASPPGTLKCTVDAGWDAVKKIAGIGIVIRDHTNSAVLSEWKHIIWCPSAEDAESIGCIEGLKHLVNLRCISGVLESDCLHAISNLQSTKTNRSNSWCYYKEGQEMLNLYPFITVAKVHRDCNAIADGLAKLGKIGDSVILYGSIPPPVADLT
jgi:ribonuclease HI